MTETQPPADDPKPRRPRRARKVAVPRKQREKQPVILQTRARLLSANSPPDEPPPTFRDLCASGIPIVFPDSAAALKHMRENKIVGEFRIVRVIMQRELKVEQVQKVTIT